MIDTQKLLIHPVRQGQGTYNEKTYDDFVSREEFINRTGIFVTPYYFDYIYDMEFKESGVSADEFINNYEKKYSTCIQEIPLHGTFKYEVMDEDVSCAGEYNECYEPNIWEIINALARNSRAEFEKRYEVMDRLVDKFQSIPDSMLLLIKITKELDLHNNILRGLLKYLADNEICSSEIIGNQFLKDIWDISFNQIKMLNEDVERNISLLNKSMDSAKEE